jgi:hypothetical protein
MPTTGVHKRLKHASHKSTSNIRSNLTLLNRGIRLETDRTNLQGNFMTSDPLPANTAGPFPRRVEGRFYIGMALATLATAFLGFGPAILDAGSRKAPLSLTVGVHGVVFSAWLVLFLTQALLVHYRRIAWHRVLGTFGAGLAIAMLISGYLTTIEMVRRGYDLSGDLIGESGDPFMVMVFQLGDLLCFGVLVALGILFRHRSGAHKRLILLATVGGMMPAALSHVIGHSAFLSSFHPAIILIPWTPFLFAGAVHDKISRGRMHPVSLWGALAVWLWSNIRAGGIGQSELWREFAGWLIS